MALDGKRLRFDPYVMQELLYGGSDDPIVSAQTRKLINEAWKNAEASLMKGKERVGTIMIFGTAGDMKDSQRDFHELFYKPETYKLKSWDDGK